MTAITTNIGTQDTVLLVDTPLANAGPYPWPMQIDSEIVYVTGGKGTIALSVVRGADGTTPAAHSIGATVAAPAGGTPDLAAVLAEGADADGVTIMGLGAPSDPNDAARLADVLPTGWTQDESDPANVSTNGGDIILGNAEGGDGELTVVASDGARPDLTLRAGSAITQGEGGNLTLQAGSGAGEGGSGDIVLDSPDGVSITGLGTTLVIGTPLNLESPSNVVVFATTLISLTSASVKVGASGNSIGFYGATPVARPEVPAVVTAQDITDALVTLGLVTQAAP